MKGLNFLIVLFGMNLVSNISIKASKKAPYMPKLALFWVQIRYKFNAHFTWDKPMCCQHQKNYTLLLKLTAHKFEIIL